MTENLKKKCELFEQNRSAVSRKFIFADAVMSTAAALVMTGADQTADIERLAECRKMLSKLTGFFSEYRDTVKLALISEMALSDDPEQYIEDVKSVYKKLHKGHFRDNSYMVLAAMLICDFGKQEQSDAIIEKHNEIMAKMNQLHPILTRSEDISYVILLALSDKPVDSIFSDMNTCMDYLKGNFKHKIGSDSIQGISELLALGDGDIKEKCDRIIRIYDALKENKANIGDGNVFISLGTLIGIDEPADQLVNDIMDADAYLKQCKGFDEKTIGKSDRLMFAVILTAESYGIGAFMANNLFINSAFGMIKAKHIATMITVLSNVLPSVISAVANTDSSETDEDKTPQPEQPEDEENSEQTE